MDRDGTENAKENAPGFKNKGAVFKKNPSFFENVKEYFCEFGDKTSLHGFNLLVERGRTIPERIYWTVVIVVGFYISVVLVNQAHKNWLNSPVVVTFATTQMGVWDIPFPAITICPQVKAHTKFFNYTDVFLKKEKGQEVTMNETKNFEYMALICDATVESLNQTQTTVSEEAVKFLREVAPDLGSIIFSLNWLGDEYEDEDLQGLFSPVLTSEGICYTFNNIDRSEIFTHVVSDYGGDYFSTECGSSDWSLEHGYSEDSEIFSSCPLRTLLAGAKGGLSLMFATFKFDIDHLCGSDVQGYKVILHHPAEVPSVEKGYFMVPLDQSVVAALKPKMMTTSSNLNHYKAEDRQCYFSTEKGLNFFKIYNQQNCLVECLTNFTLATCGCVEFHMPRENSTPICGPIKQDCVEDAKGIFLTDEQSYKLTPLGENPQLNSQNTISQKCNCLPSCTSLQFDFEYSEVDWEWREYMKIHKLTPAFKENKLEFTVVEKYSHLSRLTLFFKDMQFLATERNELKGLLELWADFGGLLGLIIGLSFISVFEVIYYLTLRLACNVILFGRHYWSGSEELVRRREENEGNELQEL